MFDRLLRAERGNSIGRMAAPCWGAGGRWSHSQAEGRLDRPRQKRGAGAARPRGSHRGRRTGAVRGGAGHRIRVAGASSTIKRWCSFPHRLSSKIPPAAVAIVDADPVVVPLTERCEGTVRLVRVDTPGGPRTREARILRSRARDATPEPSGGWGRAAPKSAMPPNARAERPASSPAAQARS
jgi:hypothetical protein